MVDYMRMIYDRNKSIPKVLSGLDNTSLYLSFKEFLNNPGAVQKEVLKDIISCSKLSDFGKDHSFENIDSIEDYKKNVPISKYPDYKFYIDKMKKGYKNVLFNGSAESFIVSSGTTGKMKYFPDSKNGVLSKNLVMKIRSIQLTLMCPDLLNGSSNILGITNSSDYGLTEGGIPIMAASGQGLDIYNNEKFETKNSNESSELNDFSDVQTGVNMILPNELITAKNIAPEDMDYLMALFALSEDKLTGVVCNNLAHFNFLLKQIQNNSEKMINDLEKNTLSVEIDKNLKNILLSKLPKNYDRVEKLKKIYFKESSLPLKDIWPKFIAVGCWLSSSVGRVAFDMSKSLPSHINYLEWGYGASEGKFNVPFEANVSGGPIAPFSCFFEFLPLDGTKALTLDKIQEENFYELVITTYSGLYRYNIQDIVSITGKTLKTPNIEFECKSSENLICKEDKYYVNSFNAIMKKTEIEAKEHISFFQLFVENNKISFIVEPHDENFDKNNFKKMLNRNLNEINIELNDLYIMKKGYRDSLFIKEVSPGKTITSTKLSTIVDKKFDESFLEEVI